MSYFDHLLYGHSVEIKSQPQTDVYVVLHFCTSSYGKGTENRSN